MPSSGNRVTFIGGGCRSAGRGERSTEVSHGQMTGDGPRWLNNPIRTFFQADEDKSNVAIAIKLEMCLPSYL